MPINSPISTSAFRARIQLFPLYKSVPPGKIGLEMETFELQSYLAPGEKLLWSGRPQRRFRWDPKYLPMVFFALPFISVFVLGPFFASPNSAKITSTQSPPALVDGSAQTASPDTPAKAKSTLVGKVFGFVFFVGFAGFFLSIIFVQFGGHRAPLFSGKVEYGVTDRRLIVCIGRRAGTVMSVDLESLRELRLKEFPDGFGTISFGPEFKWPYSHMSHSPSVTLDNIAEPRTVYQLLLSAQKS